MACYPIALNCRAEGALVGWCLALPSQSELDLAQQGVFAYEFEHVFVLIANGNFHAVGTERRHWRGSGCRSEHTGAGW